MKRVAITSVNLSHCFALLSEQFGYSRQDKIKHVFAVQKLVLEWRNNGYVEIYDSDQFKGWARAKDSNSVLGSSPYYVGLFHVHLYDGHYDPMIVITFEPEKLAEGRVTHHVTLHCLISHDEMFGPRGQVKRDKQTMKCLRQGVRASIQQHTPYPISWPLKP